ncbi:MAG: hypothetical protein ACK55I_49140, partial [bacterium]
MEAVARREEPCGDNHARAPIAPPSCRTASFHRLSSMQNAPNNLASFLLIGAGAISAPLGIGIVLILMGVV